MPLVAMTIKVNGSHNKDYPNQSVPALYHLIGQECIDSFGKINQLINQVN